MALHENAPLHQRERFTILLGFWLLFMVLEPFFDGSDLEHILDIAYLLILLSGINAVSTFRPAFYSSLVLTALGYGALNATRLSTQPLMIEAGFIIYCISYITIILITTFLIMRFAFQSGQVTRNKIAAALCVYMLLGMLWGLAYGMIEVMNPGSFSFNTGPMADPAALMPVGQQIESVLRERYSFLYYSFVTLTTLGFGDITPLTKVARSLSIVEAIVGQFFLAVLIARLMGLHIVYSTAKLKDLGENPR